jgi:hypothetical protein
MHSKEPEWVYGFMAHAVAQRRGVEFSDKEEPNSATRLHTVQPVAQFGRVDCNGSRQDAKDAKKTTATTRRIQRHQSHTVHHVTEIDPGIQRYARWKYKPRMHSKEPEWVYGFMDCAVAQRRGMEFSDTQERNSATPDPQG